MILFFIGLYISFHLSCSMEQGDFILSIDTNLHNILTEPKPENAPQLIREISMYCKSLLKVHRLFVRRRKVIMNSAKTLIDYTKNTQLFFQKFNTSNAKEIYNLTDEQSDYFYNTIEHIKDIWNGFMAAYKENQHFTYVNTSTRRAAIEEIDDRIAYMIQNPEPRSKRKVFLEIHYYFYSFGKLIKRFRLGRSDVLPVAKRLFYSQSPTFLKFLDINKFIREFQCNPEESTALATFLGKLKRRWTQFINACYENIKFEYRADVSRVNVMINIDKNLHKLLNSPDHLLAKKLMQNLITLYNTLGYLRRKNHPDILQSVKLHYGGNPLRFLSKPINLEAIRLAFKLTEEQWTTLVHLITGIRERFTSLQKQYHPNASV